MKKNSIRIKRLTRAIVTLALIVVMSFAPWDATAATTKKTGVAAAAEKKVQRIANAKRAASNPINDAKESMITLNNEQLGTEKITAIKYLKNGQAIVTTDNGEWKLMTYANNAGENPTFSDPMSENDALRMIADNAKTEKTVAKGATATEDAMDAGWEVTRVWDWHTAQVTLPETASPQLGQKIPKIKTPGGQTLVGGEVIGTHELPTGQKIAILSFTGKEDGSPALEEIGGKIVTQTTGPIIPQLVTSTENTPEIMNLTALKKEAPANVKSTPAKSSNILSGIREKIFGKPTTPATTTTEASAQPAVEESNIETIVKTNNAPTEFVQLGEGSEAAAPEASALSKAAGPVGIALTAAVIAGSAAQTAITANGTEGDRTWTAIGPDENGNYQITME